MTADYKQLAEELYEVLNEVKNLLPSYRFFTVDKVLQKYEEATTRGTGRTTALYHKAITEALENTGKSVEFIDHYPHKWDSAKHHANNLANIIDKLGYDIVVSTKGQAQVYLYNRFGR